MSRFLASRPAAIVSGALILAAAWVAAASQAPQRPPGQLPTYRAGVDLVRVDAYVVDREGRPVPGLGTTDFQVTVDGKPRTVVTADFVKLAAGGSAAGESGSGPAGAVPGRRYILVVDQHNIQPGGMRMAALAGQGFLRHLGPDDLSALVVIPAAGSVGFTNDHDRVSRALESLPGSGEALRSVNVSNVSMSEALQLDRLPSDACEPGQAPQEFTGILMRNGCLDARVTEEQRTSCCRQVMGEIRQQANAIRQATSQSLMTLESLFRALRGVEGRKTVILLSQRLVTGGGGSLDRRNDLRNVGRLAGPANATLYVLHLSRGLFEGADASLRQEAASPVGDENAAREGLEEIAGASGGAVFTVVAGADFAFERIARETSAFYLLGLEPLATDRDGKPHQIRVRTILSGATVRARTEFVIPKDDVAGRQPAAPQRAPGAAEPLPPAPVERGLEGAPAATRRMPVSPAASVLPPFERGDVLRQELTSHFARRLEAAAGEPSPGVKDALEAARGGRFELILESLAASPNDPVARVLWGVALMTRGDMDHAGAEFRAALALDPDLSPAHFYLGAWHAAAGNDTEAVPAWQRTLTTEFDQPAVFEVLIDALLRAGQVGRAGALTEDARGQWGERFTPRAAAVAIASGEIRAALDMLDPFIEQHPADVRTLALAMRAIAHVHRNGGVVFDAATDWERVARYARLYEKAGGPDKAAVAGWMAVTRPPQR